MSLIEAQAGLTNLIPCNERCGCDMEKYSWEQDDREVTVRFQLPPGTTSKQLAVQITTTQLSVSIRGEVALRGTLFKPVKLDDCAWTLEDKKVLVVTIAKGNLQYEEWWPHVVTSEPQIDMKTLKPPSKHLRELDQGAQATVAKMMFDQDQKRKGLPTSDEAKMAELMKMAGPPPRR